MILKIDEIFSDRKEYKNCLYEIKDGTTIKELSKSLNLKNTNYAVFILNNETVGIDEELVNEDKLVIMPLFSGG